MMFSREPHTHVGLYTPCRNEIIVENEAVSRGSGDEVRCIHRSTPSYYGDSSKDSSTFVLFALPRNIGDA